MSDKPQVAKKRKRGRPRKNAIVDEPVIEIELTPTPEPEDSMAASLSYPMIEQTGRVYLTQYECPCCDQGCTTIGAAMHYMMCPKCGVKMITNSALVED